MPEYLSPGVFIEEIPGQKPIQGVGTATGGFIGRAERGKIGKAELVTNWAQFVKKFGSFNPDYRLPYAVWQFFAEGGTRCFCVRAGGANSKIAKATVGGLEFTAASEGAWGNKIKVEVTAPENDTFSVRIYYDFDNNPQPVEVFEGLSADESHKEFVEERIDEISAFVEVHVPKKAKVAKEDGALADGDDGQEPAEADYIGDQAKQTGLHAFDRVDDVNILAIPDWQSGNLAKQAAGYCENRGDCFFIADPDENLTPDANGIIKYKSQCGTSAFGALYYPWLTIRDPLTGHEKRVPPSGAVAGIYSATDIKRGVHKAPAGVIDGAFNTVTKAWTVGKQPVGRGEQDSLNPLGINVIRTFPDTGPVIWGARTLAAKIDPEWRYVNVRRLMMFIEESIEEGTQWVVFEPNDRNLWGRVRRDIRAFLLLTWRSGALFGSTPDEAFFVKVDDENNPPESIDAGRLVIDVGVAPVKPAEFVIIRFTQITRSSQ